MTAVPIHILELRVCCLSAIKKHLANTFQVGQLQKAEQGVSQLETVKTELAALYAIKSTWP
jgi:hypothetical protein